MICKLYLSVLNLFLDKFIESTNETQSNFQIFKVFHFIEAHTIQTMMMIIYVAYDLRFLLFNYQNLVFYRNMWEDTLRDNLLNFASTAKGILLLQQTKAMNECMMYMYDRYKNKLQVNNCQEYLMVQEQTTVKK